MKLLYWLAFLLPYTVFAQLGVCNLDSLVEKHPYRWEIERQTLLKSRSYEDSAKVWESRFVDLVGKIDGSCCYCWTEKSMKIMLENVRNLQTCIQQVQDSLATEIPAFRQRKIARLRAAVRLDCSIYASYRGIFLLQQKGILYTSPTVKDYTTELVNFLHDKYLYTVVNGRLQPNGAP